MNYDLIQNKFILKFHNPSHKASTHRSYFLHIGYCSQDEVMKEKKENKKSVNF